MDDPIADNESKEQWNIKDDKFLREYYSGLIEYLRNSDQRKERVIGNTVFIVAPLNPFYWESFSRTYHARWKQRDTDFEIGVVSEIYKKPESAFDSIKILSQNIDEGKVGNEDGVGKDGIAIFGQMSEWKVA